MIQRYGKFLFFGKGSGTSFSTAFCVWFLKKNTSHVIFYQLTKRFPLPPEILINICIAIVCELGCDAVNFEINLIFLIKPFSTRPKSQDENLNILRTKRGFKMNKKHFSSFFMGLLVAKNLSQTWKCTFE